MKAAVYNISPDTFTENAGRFGNFTFPGKKDGEPYSKTVIDDVKYWNDKGDDQKELNVLDGFELAKDLVSKNEGFGCFAKYEHEPVTEEDIQKAKSTLEAHDRQLVLSASATWESTHDHRLINGNARNAARRLGLKVEWAMDDASFTVIQCPFCRESVKRGSIKCKNCSEFLTLELNPKLAQIGWTPEKAIPVITPVAPPPEIEEAAFAVTKRK